MKIENEISTILEVKEKPLEMFASKRQKCLVYTRVMGYHRPVESFNLGKKGEHKQRAHFKE